MLNRIVIFVSIISIIGLSCGEVKKKDTIVEKISTSNEDAKKCIDDIILLDEKAGKIRNHRCENASLSSAIEEYIAQLENVDYSNCPAEFGKSFRAHIEAWRSTITIAKKHDALRGEMHDLFDEINESQDSTEFTKLVKGIWDTWRDVEVVMAKGSR